MTKKLFKSLAIGEHFGLSAYDETVLMRIKQQPGKGSVPFFNAKDTGTGQLLHVPVRRYIYSDGRKGKRK